MMKHCARCNRLKPLDEFPLSRGKPRSYCRVCWRVYRKAANALYRARHPESNLRLLNNRLFGRGQRELVIKRDGERCVMCGMTRAEHRSRHNRDITVDHIDGNGIGKPVSQKNNDLSNLQTLCLPCHLRKDNKMRRDARLACKHGHPYTEASVYLYKGSKICRECNRLRVAKFKECRPMPLLGEL